MKLSKTANTCLVTARYLWRGLLHGLSELYCFLKQFDPYHQQLAMQKKRLEAYHLYIQQVIKEGYIEMGKVKANDELNDLARKEIEETTYDAAAYHAEEDAAPSTNYLVEDSRAGAAYLQRDNTLLFIATCVYNLHDTTQRTYDFFIELSAVEVEQIHNALADYKDVVSIHHQGSGDVPVYIKGITKYKRVIDTQDNNKIHIAMSVDTKANQFLQSFSIRQTALDNHNKLKENKHKLEKIKRYLADREALEQLKAKCAGDEVAMTMFNEYTDNLL